MFVYNRLLGAQGLLPRITALSDFTIVGSVDDGTIAEPETITRHGVLYLEDGSVEDLCGRSLFRVHTRFRFPVLRRSLF